MTLCLGIRAKTLKRLAKYLSKSPSIDHTNEERPNSQTDYENEIKDAFANDDNFDPEEALEDAADKRKFLMKRLFGDTCSTNTL